MKSDQVYLEHIREALLDIQRFVAGMTKEEFLTERKTQYAVLQAFEIVGEATNRVSQSLRAAHPEVPWRRMIDFRNKLIHHYFGISMSLVWDTIGENVPEVLRQLDALFDQRS